MSSRSLLGYAMRNDPCQSPRPSGRPFVDLHAKNTLCKHVSPHCLCLTATRIYQAAFITMMMTMTKAKTKRPRLAYQVAVAVAHSPLPAACCLTHDLFLLCCSDNSNAICVSHRLYLLHVSISFYFVFFLAIFGMQLKLPLTVCYSIFNA